MVCGFAFLLILNYHINYGPNHIGEIIVLGCATTGFWVHLGPMGMGDHWAPGVCGTIGGPGSMGDHWAL